ncbi:hypothetical protein [uncultured Pluralibacter sp.]|uniref:hypothetical protein n=1 Tax=uncultured Pluralibacter sp. TaxID=1490864 RepID=UPI002610CD62|nr:hypothetical protein [uncultured Pluralibacter sp.]
MKHAIFEQHNAYAEQSLVNDSDAPSLINIATCSDILKAVAAIRAAKERLMTSDIQLQMQQSRFQASLRIKSD